MIQNNPNEISMYPYPGLRPFNDDESIFFKGRDKNIDSIIELLEKNKFVMLTGASGDGKSSLVYAGIAPHARAGLFKAKYNNWIIADFRPERTPLQNLSKSLQPYLSFANHNDLENELSLGFSSLIDIYKKSEYYIDVESENWKQADAAQQKALKRKSANLLIIADQFEEFFTNAENYQNGIASLESQTAVHLLLETAKLALAQDIPIYVICTMRSDYIGQCAAFRGLPEYIGFSQFFVPRLKRNEILQVIEEPAQLNGDRINRRLTERLLNDVTEGYDQLPILQHALNQIWKIAQAHNEEMDLIHYSKVGGLSKSELNAKDKKQFEEWYQLLPDYRKRFFEHPSLGNVLNAHADEILETAYQNLQLNHPQDANKISEEDAKQIIKSTFKCLTKIDDARAVRNRMTLQEIADITNLPNADADVIGKLLDVFRAPGNSFLKPFITGYSETLKTNKDTVLDITHESLIRNWDILDVWAKEEWNDLLNWQDFNKQMERWVENNKEKGFLLPIGPLTYFEGWYISKKPNKYWLARYDEREIAYEQKVREADDKLANAKQFIKKSANALFISRTVLKYGANRILTGLGILALIISCTYYYFDFRKKQNAEVIDLIEFRGLELLNSNNVENSVKAKFIINYERLHPNTFEKIIKDNSQHDTIAFNISSKILDEIVNISEGGREIDTINPIAYRVISKMNELLNKIESTKKTNNLNTNGDLRRTNRLLKICFILINNKDKNPILKDIFIKCYQKIDAIVRTMLSSKVETLHPASQPLIESISLLISLNSTKNPIKLENILQAISPFENEMSKQRFLKLFPKDVNYDFGGGQMTHNGGFQILSYLYASENNIEKLNQCIDSLIINNKEYKSFYFHNFNSILYCLMKYDNRISIEQINKLVSSFTKKTGYDFEKVIHSFISISCNYKLDHWKETYFLKGEFSDYFQINLPLENKERLNNLYWELKKTELKSIDEVYFEQANYLKERGILEWDCNKINDNEAFDYFSQAFNFYNKVSSKFLSKKLVIKDLGKTKSISISGKFLFPGIINLNQNLSETYQVMKGQNIFADFLIAKKEKALFNTNENIELFVRFLYGYYEVNFLNNDIAEYNFENLKTINFKYFDFIKNGTFKNLLTEKQHQFIKLVYLNKAFNDKKNRQTSKLLREINLETILSTSFQNQNGLFGATHRNLISLLAINCAKEDNNEYAFKFVHSFSDPSKRRNLLIDISNELQKSGNEDKIYPFLDSLFIQIKKENKFNLKLFYILGKIGSNESLEISKSLIKDIDDNKKTIALNKLVAGLANIDLFFKAKSVISDYLSSTNELELLNKILHAEAIKLIKEDNRFWKRVDTQYENIGGYFVDEIEEGYREIYYFF